MANFPFVKCKTCGRPFETQVKIDPAIYAMYPNLRVGDNNFTCPHCDNVRSYSERDFQYTPNQADKLATFGKIVLNIVHEVEQSENPLKRATKLLEEFEKAKNANDISQLKDSSNLVALRKWLPDTPEKIAAYLVIIQIIIQFLTKNPGQKIEHNTVINQFQQNTIIQQTIEPSKEPTAPFIKSKPLRNESCPCGSGKKFKRCCGGIKSI